MYLELDLEAEIQYQFLNWPLNHLKQSYLTSCFKKKDSALVHKQLRACVENGVCFCSIAVVLTLKGCRDRIGMVSLFVGQKDCAVFS